MPYASVVIGNFADFSKADKAMSPSDHFATASLVQKPFLTEGDGLLARKFLGQAAAFVAARPPPSREEALIQCKCENDLLNRCPAYTQDLMTSIKSKNYHVT